MSRYMHRRGESGFTLVEVAVAISILMLVVAAVAASVTAIAEQTTKLSSSSQSIGALQMAEESLVQDLHAANAWYSSSNCTGTFTVNSTAVNTAMPSTTTAPPYYFTANLFGNTPCINVTLSGSSSETITITSSITVNGSPEMRGNVVVSNLDPTGTSIAPSTSPVQQPVAVTVNQTTSYYTDRMSVVLTQDSPRVGAQHEVKTTMSDPAVIAFPIEYACQWTADGASNSC